MARLLPAIALWPRLVAAILQVNYPLNLQLPPIAFADTPYQYQFPSSTFQVDSDQVQYSLVGSPSWLSLDSNNRTLSGTPHISDVGEISFKIVAAGSAGAVVHMDSRLLITKDDGPKVNGNISQVLSDAGPLSGPRTINLRPAKPFDISFPSDTFGSNGTPLSYYALLSDHTPLPAWISFDASSLHFAGNTPPIGSSQTFEILLLACATPGYAASSLSFAIAISSHQLVFQPYNQHLNISKGETVQITDLKSKLFLDGSPIQDADIRSISAKMPSWLKLDDKTFEISGSPSSGTMSQDVTVTASDKFGDVAQFNIHFLFTSELFANEIGQLNATVGEYFEYTMPDGTFIQKDEMLSVDLSSLSHYLYFDPATSSISGTIPNDFPSQHVHCLLTANSSDGALTDTQTFQIAVSEGTGGANVSSIDEKNSGRKMAGIIVGSIVGAICGTLLLATLALRLRRGKKRDGYVSPNRSGSPKKSDIGRPELIPYGLLVGELDHDEDLEKGKNEHDVLVERSLEHPQTLGPDSQVDQRDSLSLGDSISDVDTKILDTFEESSYGIQNDITPSQHPHDSMKIPTELAKRSSQKSDTFRKHRRRTTTIYQDHIQRSTGLPVNRRITGAGHGRQRYSSSRSNTHFSQSSLRRPQSTSSYTTTRCTSTFSTAPSAFPQQPVAQQHTAEVTTPTEQRQSIRVVPASTRSSLVDRQTLDDKRNSFIRQRASAQSPFFSAVSRVSSSTYKSPPAFITETPTKADTDTLPNESMVEYGDQDFLNSLSFPGPSISPISEPRSKDFPGSLRKNRIPRPYTSIGGNYDRIEKSYARPGTAVGNSAGGLGRHASTRDSLRAFELKSRLNHLTGSEIFKDAELSDSVYTDEEDEIEEAERRVTVKPGQFTLPPLNIDTGRRNKRDSIERKKRTSKRDSHKELKRTSERKFDRPLAKLTRWTSTNKIGVLGESTPYYHFEHGGKENHSSTYSLGSRSTPTRTETQRKTKSTSSPERPKQVARHSRTASDTRKSHRSSNPHTSRALSQQGPIKERHSRKSLHSRTQSRQSAPAGKKTRSHSRSQSSAYPYFDPSLLDARPSSIGNAITRPTSIGNAITTSADSVCMPESNTKSTLTVHDVSGDSTYYGVDEEPTVEELRSSSIGFPTSNGRISSTAQSSRLASLHESSRFNSPPLRSSKRETSFPFPSSSPPPVRSAGLALFPVDARPEPYVSETERTPLSGLAKEDRESPKVGEETPDVSKGRQTWGSLKSIVGKGGRWVSGGYWDKQGKEEKAFI